jgi:hypothetical protein
VPVFISPRDRVAQLYPSHWVPFSSPPTAHRATVVDSIPPPHGLHCIVKCIQKYKSFLHASEDLIENTQKYYEMHSVISLTCRVATAVKAMCISCAEVHFCPLRIREFQPIVLGRETELA